MEGIYRLKLQRYEGQKLVLTHDRKLQVWDVEDILLFHKSRSKQWEKLVHKDPRCFTFKFTYSLNPLLTETLSFIFLQGAR